MRFRSLGTMLPLLLITAVSVHAGVVPEHFLFYSTTPHEDAPKFVKLGPVHLADQFGAGDYDVQSPRALGLPTDKNGGGVVDPETHLQEFAIKARGSFDKLSGIRVTNQCNDVAVEVIKPVSLLVPSTKRLQAPPGPVPNSFDHFLCYKAKAELPKGMQVETSDQFQSRRYDLKKLTKLCLPVAKSGNPVLLSGPTKGTPFPITPSVIAGPTIHYLCYQAKLSSKVIPQNACVPWREKEKGTKMDPKQAKHTPRLGVLVTGQFGTEELDTKNAVELCIPSDKNPVCGNAILQPNAGEQCDDGNTNDGDGCSARCLTEVVSPANDDLPACVLAAYSDFWTFDVIAGQNVVVSADTTAASTAADLVIDIDCPGVSLSGDDEVPCTFQPPSAQCPRAAFTAPATGTCVVQVHNFRSCASDATAAYSLTVTRDTVPARVALRDDDACAEICTDFAAPGTYPFTVPKDVGSIIIDAFGAQGGAGRLGGQGGRGGRAITELTVTPGETFQINVGGRGGNSNMTTGGAGGSNGGAAGGNSTFGGPGGGGGGASDLRESGTTLADRVLVAGGGGGSGGGTDCCGFSPGGAGGDGGGTNGTNGSPGGGANGGGGATDSAGGMGAVGGMNGETGTPGSGGGGADGDGAGGGGGGGLFGGGGGAGNVNELGGGGGGGGSGTGPANSVLLNGERVGHGLVRIIVQ